MCSTKKSFTSIISKTTLEIWGKEEYELLAQLQQKCEFVIQISDVTAKQLWPIYFQYYP